MQFKLEGLSETISALSQLSRPTSRNVLRRVLRKAGEPVANDAAAMAPERSGILAFSVSVSPQLTRRQKREGKTNEVEMYIGPAGGAGALAYASFVEFGTAVTPAHPFMRPAWEGNKMRVLDIIKSELRIEVEKSAARAARRVR